VVTEEAVFFAGGSSDLWTAALGAALRFKPHHQITFAAKNLLNTNSRAVI
jgi:hypothetical protein